MKDMNDTRKIVFGAVFVFLCGFFPFVRASGQALPDDKGKAEFVHNCTACHRADMVVAVKKTPAEWRKSVDEMAARGTDGTKEDLDNVVLYLDKYFSKDKPAATDASPAPPPQTPPKPDKLKVMSLSDTELRRYVTA